MKSPDGGAVVHGVEGSDLVDAHGRHFQPSGNFVHDGDGGEAMLALAEIEEGHYSGFFVLWRVAFEDLCDEFFVDGVEFEGDGGIVVGAVAVLQYTIVSAPKLGKDLLSSMTFVCSMEMYIGEWEAKRTTWRASLLALGVVDRCLHNRLVDVLAAYRNEVERHGASMDAMMTSKKGIKIVLRSPSTRRV